MGREIAISSVLWVDNNLALITTALERVKIEGKTVDTKMKCKSSELSMSIYYNLAHHHANHHHNVKNNE